MAPTKPMGTTPKGSKPGVTGFVQDYNQDPGPRQDLNPDAVDDPDSLPEPQKASRGTAAPNSTGAWKGARKGARKGTAKK